MFLIDLEQGRIIDDAELKNAMSPAEALPPVDRASRATSSTTCPKAKALPKIKAVAARSRSRPSAIRRKTSSSSSSRWPRSGEEATGSMGNDTALPVLSSKNKPLYHYFKQLFAQVTNPPIDPIREEIVMSLTSFIGPKPNLLGIADNEETLTPRLEVTQPVLTDEDCARLRDIDRATKGRFKSLVLDITYPANEGAAGCEAALERLCAAAEKSVGDGASDEQNRHKNSEASI